MKKLRYYLITFLAILFLPLFFSGNSFADSNPTYTMTSMPSDRVYLCNNDDASTSVLNIKCSDYSYINITLSGSVNIRFNSNFGGYSQNISLRVGNFKFYTFDTAESSNLSVDPSYSSGIIGADSSVTFVFSNTPIGASSPSAPSGSLSITENGTYDVTNYASAVVNVPTETVVTDLPPYSELVVDSFWNYHVAIAGGLASIFAIFVVYRIIKSRLR